MAFRTSVDIANRALQHLGATRISNTLGFTEDSKRASAMAFAYDKLRPAELRSNTWKFSTRKAALRPVDTTTMVIAPALWSSTTTYRLGQIVTDAGNTLWISNFPDNLNNAPGNSFFWDTYAGPLTCSPWDSTQSYFAGELVYTYPGDGTFLVYLSLTNANSATPATGTPYAAATTYMRDQVVSYLSTSYISLIDLNLNNTPSAAVGVWAVGTTYASGAHVYGSDGFVYVSVGNGNVGNNPTTDLGVHWTNTGVLQPWAVTTTGTGSLNWLQITPIALTDLFIIWPLGSGPLSQNSTRNAYRLPAAFLRAAPQDPKAGSVSYLGTPGGRAYDDWLYEGDFIVTGDSGVIIYRFIADIQDVTKMDDMFCEGLAARMGFETCEEITQSTAKQSACAAAYKQFMGVAKTTDSIETGSVEPPIDDYLSCRA